MFPTRDSETVTVQHISSKRLKRCTTGHRPPTDPDYSYTVTTFVCTGHRFSGFGWGGKGTADYVRLNVYLSSPPGGCMYIVLGCKSGFRIGINDGEDDYFSCLGRELAACFHCALYVRSDGISYLTYTSGGRTELSLSVHLTRGAILSDLPGRL